MKFVLKKYHCLYQFQLCLQLYYSIYIYVCEQLSTVLQSANLVCVSYLLIFHRHIFCRLIFCRLQIAVAVYYVLLYECLRPMHPKQTEMSTQRRQHYHQ